MFLIEDCDFFDVVSAISLSQGFDCFFWWVNETTIHQLEQKKLVRAPSSYSYMQIQKIFSWYLLLANSGLQPTCKVIYCIKRSVTSHEPYDISFDFFNDCD